VGKSEREREVGGVRGKKGGRKGEREREREREGEESIAKTDHLNMSHCITEVTFSSVY
jgi:hypothetical protein